MDVRNIPEDALTQGFEVMLGATLSEFPNASCYRYLFGDHCSELTGPADFNRFELGECTKEHVELFEREPHIWVHHTYLWCTLEGTERAVQIAPSLLDSGSQYFGSEHGLYASLKALTLGRIEMIQQCFDIDLSAYYVNAKRTELLNRIEDDRVRDVFRIFLASNPDMFHSYLSPNDLADKTHGVWCLCEIEDQAGSDFSNEVFYIPNPLIGSG